MYTKQEAVDEAEKVRQEITLLELEKSDIRLEQYDTEIVRDFAEKLLFNLDLLWERMDLPKKVALTEKIFISGILCSKDKSIRTSNLSPSFKLIKALGDGNIQNVSKLGTEVKIYKAIEVNK